jgi:phenylalanyl-tRNA synthetase beta chain
MVDTGDGGAPVQVVCGAPNARAGLVSVFSPPGTFIPGKNITLGVGTIRGVESRGMLVSEFELKLSDDHEGIIELPQDAPVGANYAAWAKLDDPVLEIKLTPNRADCTGVHGIARDLAAAGLGKLKEVVIAPVKGTGVCPCSVKLDFGATPSLCRAFVLRLVRGVNGAGKRFHQLGGGGRIPDVSTSIEKPRPPSARSRGTWCASRGPPIFRSRRRRTARATSGWASSRWSRSP